MALMQIMKELRRCLVCTRVEYDLLEGGRAFDMDKDRPLLDALMHESGGQYEIKRCPGCNSNERVFQVIGWSPHTIVSKKDEPEV